ncbi:MAG: PAS-domain containing protein [Rhodospirillales bacterium]
MTGRGQKSAPPGEAPDNALLSGLDHLDQGVLVIGADLMVRAGNRILYDIYEFPEGFIRGGMPMADVFRFLAQRGDYGPDDPDVVVERMLGLIRKGKRSNTEMRLGTGRTVEVRRSPLPDGGMIAVTTDVTERHDAAEALRQSEQRFRDIAEIASDWFWEMDAELRFSYFSDRNREILGFDMASIIGKRRTDVTPENVDARKWQDHLNDLAARRPFKDFRYDIRPPGADLRHISISGKPVFGTDGRFLGYRGVGRDLTRDNAAETALKVNLSLLQATLDATADGILVSSLDRQLQAFNQRFIEMFAVPGDLVAARDGWKVRDWIASLAEEPDVFCADVERIYAEPDKEFRTTLKLKDGRIIERYTRPQYLGDVIVGRVISFRDATDQIRIAEELHSQKTLLETVFRDVPDAMVLVDADRRVRMCNPAFTRVFGYAVDDVIGRTAEFLYENDDVYKRDGCSRIEAAGDDILAPYIVSYRHKSGDVFPGETVGSSLRAKNNDIIGFIAVIRDVGARIKAETERLEALELAEDANRAKSAFLANVSHDLRTPLNAVLGFAEIIKQQLLGPVGHPKYVEYAEDIRDSGAYLLDLVNDLLDISTIEAGQRAIRRETIRLDPFFAECVKAATARISRGAMVSVNMDAKPASLKADRRAMKQVVLNLLSNSLKFTPPEGQIVITARRDGKRSLFSVADTGKGIPKENLKDITQAFERGQSSAYATADGTGLGLAIARSLVELHGGELTIDSELGKGTEVSFFIPDPA